MIDKRIVVIRSGTRSSDLQLIFPRSMMMPLTIYDLKFAKRHAAGFTKTNCSSYFLDHT